jgi:hypothetical protein
MIVLADILPQRQIRGTLLHFLNLTCHYSTKSDDMDGAGWRFSTPYGQWGDDRRPDVIHSRLCRILYYLLVRHQYRVSVTETKNIIPALIIVRAGLGHSIQDKIESQLSRPTPSRGGERQNPSFEVLDLKPRAGKCIETV